MNLRGLTGILDICTLGGTIPGLTGERLARSRQVRLLVPLAMLCVLAVGSTKALGEEPYLEFLEGLRSRGYFDYALLYLDELDARSDIPPAIREVLPYQRGVTLLAQARLLTNLDRQREYLDRAAASLEQFTMASPGHELSGQANTDRALILLEKARVELWKSQEPANEGNEEAFREPARELIRQAREVFQAAHDQHKAAYTAFGFIPEGETVRRAERDRVEGRYLEAKLYLAQCSYWLAQTFPRESQEFRDQLTAASIEFEDIHTEHRQQTVGLVARLWQGKCFEEQNELGPAMGIYDQFLNNPGTSQTMLELKSTALYFKLICLNHDLKKEYELASLLAEEWDKSPEVRMLRRTEIGLGITYERARALHGYALTLEQGTKRNEALNQALALARSVNLFPGQYKILSSRLIQQILLALNRDPADPRDFESAYGMGSELLGEISTLRSEYERLLAQGNRTAALDKLEQLRAVAAESVRLFDLALRLVGPTTDPRTVQLAHNRLAYAYLTQGKYYEAAAIAEFLLDKLAEDYPELAVECGFIGVTAFDYAYTEADPDNRDFEATRLLEMAAALEEQFPDSARANDARFTIAKVFSNSGQPVEAATWYERVPPSADNFGQAQLFAGQMYWRAYSEALALPDEERPPASEVDLWLDRAEERLSTGIALRQSQLPEGAESPEELALGKLSLAQIRNRQGVYTTRGETVGALELLSADPHSVLSAIRVEPGETRPPAGRIKSQQIAGFALQQLLRAQIGAASEAEGDRRQQFMDASAQTRTWLEELATEDGDRGALTQIYIEFGRELQKELNEIQDSGDLNRLREVRTGFESFLNDVADRREGQTRSSLVWIAETFAALGENATDDPARAQSYFTRAAETYSTMLRRAESEAGFVDHPDHIVSIRLSLARTRRREKNFPEAERVLNDVLATHPAALDVQSEAALLYQMWGESGVHEKYRIAFEGRSTEPAVWGWGGISGRLQRSAEQGDEEARVAYLNAKVHVVDCLLGFGKSGSTPEHEKALQQARIVLESLVINNRESFLADRMQDFERQYTAVLTELGLPRIPLAQVSTASEPIATNGRTPGSTAGIQAASTASSQGTGPGTNWGLLIAMGLLGIASVIGLCYMSINQSRRRHRGVAAQAKATSRKTRGRANVG